MALTDTTLKALKPKPKAYVVSDDRSLYAEVLPTGAIVWRFRYRLNGKRDEAAQLVAMGELPAQKKQRDKIAVPEGVRRRRKGTEPHDWRRAWRVQPSRIRQAAPGDAAVLVGLSGQARAGGRFAVVAGRTA